MTPREIFLIYDSSFNDTGAIEVNVIERGVIKHARRNDGKSSNAS
jgi:hypothetical protein